MVVNFTFLMFLLGPPVVAEVVLLFLLFRYYRARERRAGWIRILLFNFLSCLVLLLFGCLGGEFYFRYVYDATDALAYTKVSKRWFDRHFVYNKAGARDNVEYMMRVEPGTRRVSFVGDSFAAGHGIKNVEDRFANVIRAKHSNWDVHVLAVVGNDTDMELDLVTGLRQKGYEFDCVVLVYCLNDISDLSPDWLKSVAEVYADRNRGGWLRQHSYFLDIVYHRYKAAHDPRVSQYYTFVRDGYRGSIWETQKAQLRKMRDFVGANGGRFVVVTFPFLQLEGPNYEFQSVHDQLNLFWKEMGVPHLDLQPVFAGEKPEKITLNRYDAHPNEYANKLAAKAIDQFLGELLAKSPAKGPPPANESMDR
jgi:hypothetical protein